MECGDGPPRNDRQRQNLIYIPNRNTNVIDGYLIPETVLHRTVNEDVRAKDNQ